MLNDYWFILFLLLVFITSLYFAIFHRGKLRLISASISAIALCFVVASCISWIANGYQEFNDADLPPSSPLGVSEQPREGIYVEMQYRPDAGIIRLDDGNYSYRIDSETIPYKVINATGKTAGIVHVPKLEVLNSGVWESVEHSNVAGFCGTQNTLEQEDEGELCLDWYENLSVGRYRLTFYQHSDGNYEYFEYAEFELYDGKTPEAKVR